MRWVETEHERKGLLTFLEKQPLPISVDIQHERHRTTKQNKLNRQWMNDIAGQAGENAEYWRGYCKLHFGIAILKADREGFDKVYDDIIRPLPYEAKITLMCVPFDYPVTRDFNSRQMKAYLDAVQKHFAERGISLTDPEDARWEST